MNAYGWRNGKGVYAIPVGCALLALATVLVVSNGAGDDGPVRSDAALEVPTGVSKDVVDAVLSSSAEQSSPQTFLGDLERAARSGNKRDTAVSILSWTRDRDLPDTAEEALTAYRDCGAATLMASGYLDLSGNVWAAMMRLDSGAVDVMTVSTADDRESQVRVARLAPDGL